MKKVVELFCCMCLMICGASLAVYKINSAPDTQTVMAQPLPLQWSANRNNVLPLDLQLDLEKRLSNETPTKDSVHIRDSVRIVEKIKWKTRYKSVADRTAAREVGEHLMAVNPDSMSNVPTLTSTLGREEKPNEVVDTPKVSSIKLIVDGQTVYSRNDNHSTGEGQ